MKTFKQVGTGMGMLFAVCALAGGGVHAATPPLKTQVPGWYRLTVGDFEVTALYDGHIDLETKIFKHAKPGEIDKGRDRAFMPLGDKVVTSVNAFLVNTGTHLVLVDTGAAKSFGPALGFVVTNMKASGYQPAQVDVVVITHLHGDHVGGLLSPDGKMAFPNAQVMVAKSESAFWLDPAQLAKAPKEMAKYFQLAQSAAGPYQAANKWKVFDPDAEIVPGVKAVSTPGHTPGHSSYLFESKGEKMLVLGDVVHFGAVQFPRPEISIAFDADEKAALATRKKVFADAASKKTLVAGEHLTFPGLGHIRVQDKGFVWVPVEFTAFAP